MEGVWYNAYLAHNRHSVHVCFLLQSSRWILRIPSLLLWTSLVAQTVKNRPERREAWVGKIPEEGMATYSSILAWRIPMDRGAWRATAHGVAKSWT